MAPRAAWARSGGRGVGEPGCFKRPRVALIVASASLQSSANNATPRALRPPGADPKGRFKPPHARQLASRRQLKFPSEWRLLSTLLKHSPGAATKLNHEVQPRRPTTPGARAHADAPARGPSAVASKSFFSRAFQPPAPFRHTTLRLRKVIVTFNVDPSTPATPQSSAASTHFPQPQDFRFASSTLPN